MCEFQFGISAAVLESNGNLKVHCQIIAPGTAGAPQHHAAAEQRVRLLSLYVLYCPRLAAARAARAALLTSRTSTQQQSLIMASSSAPPRVPQTDAKCRNMTELSTRIAAVGEEVKHDPAFRFMNASVRNASVLARLLLAMTYHT